MKLFCRSKDGGPASTVTAYWLIEWKRCFSVAVLCFDHGSREAFHSHAFNSVSWLLWGQLGESYKESPESTHFYYPSMTPIITKRSTYHRVASVGRSWAITFRGPWSDYWAEYLPKDNKSVTLTHGRVEV
jgi:hypothetical protein